jgi:hypothetical protein
VKLTKCTIGTEDSGVHRRVISDRRAPLTDHGVDHSNDIARLVYIARHVAHRRVILGQRALHTGHHHRDKTARMLDAVGQPVRCRVIPGRKPLHIGTGVHHGDDIAQMLILTAIGHGRHYGDEIARMLVLNAIGHGVHHSDEITRMKVLNTIGHGRHSGDTRSQGM